MAKIAFIGLGNMGGPMAGNLSKAQHHVAGFDLVPALCEAASGEGVHIATSAIEAVKEAEAVITMLPRGEHVLAVWTEILPHVPKGALMIDCSTIDVATAKRVHAMAAERGLEAVDAPVSGGVPGAKAATLTLMVGGTQSAYERAKPILEKVGKKVAYCGDAGLGQAAKICNNMIAGISMLATAEGFVLGEKLGLSPEALYDVASTSSGQCWAITSYCPVPGLVPASPANNDFKPGFAIELLIKDLGLAQSASRETGSATPMGAEALNLYKLFADAGNTGRDFSSIIEFIRGKA